MTARTLLLDLRAFGCRVALGRYELSIGRVWHLVIGARQWTWRTP